MIMKMTVYKQITRHLSRILVVAALGGAALQSSWTEAGDTLGFSGTLTSTANGTPFSGSLDIWIGLYDASGTPLRGECFTNTQVTGGRFGVGLGVSGDVFAFSR